MSTPTDPTACHPATAAVRAGIDRDTAFGAVTPPIVLSSNFSFDGFGNKRQYDYTRSGNPTRDLLGEALAELEGGAGGVVTATGMGAITLVLHALLDTGDKLVVPHDAYGGSWRLFNALAKKGHFELITADLTDTRSLADALAQSPKVVLIETPTGGVVEAVPVRAAGEALQAKGAAGKADKKAPTRTKEELEDEYQHRWRSAAVRAASMPAGPPPTTSTWPACSALSRRISASWPVIGLTAHLTRSLMKIWLTQA